MRLALKLESGICRDSDLRIYIYIIYAILLSKLGLILVSCLS